MYLRARSWAGCGVAASRQRRDYFKLAISNFYTAEELSSVLRLVGFADVRCRKSVWGGMVAFHRATRAPRD